MVKISRNWIRMNREERIAFAESVLQHTKENPYIHISDPALGALESSHARAADSQARVKEMERKLAELRARRDADVDALMDALEQMAEALEQNTEGDPEKIATTGYEPVGGTPSHPIV